MQAREIPVLVSLLAVAGCAALAPSTDPAQREKQALAATAATEAAATSAAAAVPPPWGLIIAGLTTAIGTAIAAHYRGKDIGWTDAKGKPPTPPAV